MSVLAVVLSIGFPGAATSNAGQHPGWPELWNLVISLAIVGLLCWWIERARREQAARLREKVVPFPFPNASRIVTGLGVLLVAGVAQAQTPSPALPTVDVRHTNDGSFKDSQTTLTVGLVHGFAGKIGSR